MNVMHHCVGLGVVCWGMAAAANAQAPPREKDPLEQRIDKALSFLHGIQERDGSWAGQGLRGTAYTSLAVMAFLASGHVPGEGPYGETVEKAIRHVISNQKANGLLTQDFGMEMYHHGISTLMLAEVCGMTDAALAREVRPALEKAVVYLLRSQRLGNTPLFSRGGWRYMATGSDADLSVTGWQLLALRAAKNVGCDVPAESIDLAVDYVLRCRDPQTGGFAYQPGGQFTIPCTGTGILTLEICGSERRRRECLQAGAFLLKSPPRWSDMHFSYGIYYSSQAMFQLGNNYWNVFRPHLHKVLFDQQQHNGAWVSNAEPFGPAYTTAMAVLALTVEYRLLPIYQRHEEPDQKK